MGTSVVTFEWTTVIAVYGAITATVALMWDFWKWKTAGPRLHVTAQANMATYNMPAFDGNDVMLMHVTNRGDRPTTITHFTVHGFGSWWQWVRKRPEFNAVVQVAHDMQPPPFVLQPGCTWNGVCLQDEELVKWAKKGKVALGLCHSHSRKTVYRRVLPRAD